MSGTDNNLPEGLGDHLTSLQQPADAQHQEELTPVAPASAPTEDLPATGLGAVDVELDDEPQAPTAVEAPAAPAPAAAPAEPVAQQARVIQEAETFLPLGPDVDDLDYLILPAGTNDEINKAIEEAPNVRMDDTEATADWAQTLTDGVAHTLKGGALGGTVRRPSAEFSQYPKTEGGQQLGAGAPTFKDKPGTLLTGERAQLRVKALLGMGSVVQVPLWHSGIWVTFKAPDDSSKLELQRRLMQEKVDLGRLVHAMIYSNHSVYIAQWLLDFAFAHIYSSSFKEDAEKKQYLRDQIVSMDIPLVIWGLLCVMYPRGYPYAKACVADPSKCNYVIREQLDISKLLWTDTRSLTEWQLAHMSDRKAVHNADVLSRYRKDFVAGRNRTVSIDPRVKITLRVPTVNDYTTAGSRWVQGIVTLVDRAFGLEPNDDQRNVFINEQSKANNMRQFIHWIDSVEIAGMSHPIEDRETLEMTINTLSQRDDIAEEYYTAIGKFIDDSTISVVAIPSHSCPQCGDEVKSELPRYPHLLPLDVMSTFFTLLGQAMARVRNR